MGVVCCYGGNKLDLGKEILKSIQIIVDRKLSNYKADRTYKSRIKAVKPNKGYVILDNAGSERTVKCCIPNLELKIGQSVWVKEPMGKLSDIHIVGVVQI